MIEVKRLDWLDLAKGIGIVLVVLGHTLFPLHSAIDVFHMPLFFILAGLTLKVVRMDSFLLRKIDSIFIPYIFFSMVSVPISYAVPHESVFNGPLWFLQTLFIALIIAQLIIKFAERKHPLSVLGGVILAVIIYTWALLHYNTWILPFFIDRALRAVPFVLIGYIVKDYFLLEAGLLKKYMLFIASLLLFIFAFSAYYAFFTPSGTFKMGEIMQPCLPLFYLSAIGGSFAVIGFCRIVNKVRIVNWLGRNSLVIMCVHFPLVQWLNTNVSKTSYYTGGALIKVLISISIVSVSLCFGAICVIICKKCIPNLTGYKRNFKTL